MKLLNNDVDKQHVVREHVNVDKQQEANYYHYFSRFAFFFPKKKFLARKASCNEFNKVIHSGQFVKIPYHTYIRLLDSLE